MPRDERSDIVDFMQDSVFRAVLGAVLALPYPTRVRLMGRVAAGVIAPIAGWRRRIRENLAHVLPDFPAEEVERLVRSVPDNVGRTLIEIYSGAEFKDRVGGAGLTGEGVGAFDEARRAGRPVMLVTAHFGNFDALRATLSAAGHELGAIYRQMNNRRFNEHYVRALSGIGTPLFPTSREGQHAFRAYLGDGGIVGILTDIYSSKGAEVDFFGKPAPTSAAACAWAVETGALVIPCFGRRRADGLTFDAILETPVPLGDPVEMTQAITDRLEARVRQDMEQWFWIHRRWKPERRRGRRGGGKRSVEARSP